MTSVLRALLKAPHLQPNGTIVEIICNHYATLFEGCIVFVGPTDHIKDPANFHDFRHPPCIGPWNQNVGSLCLCGLLGPWYLAKPPQLRLHVLDQLMTELIGETCSKAKGASSEGDLSVTLNHSSPSMFYRLSFQYIYTHRVRVCVYIYRDVQMLYVCTSLICRHTICIRISAFVHKYTHTCITIYAYTYGYLYINVYVHIHTYINTPQHASCYKAAESKGAAVWSRTRLS